jgi:hypothetical protein
MIYLMLSCSHTINFSHHIKHKCEAQNKTYNSNKREADTIAMLPHIKNSSQRHQKIIKTSSTNPENTGFAATRCKGLDDIVLPATVHSRHSYYANATW